MPSKRAAKRAASPPDGRFGFDDQYHAKFRRISKEEEERVAERRRKAQDSGGGEITDMLENRAIWVFGDHLRELGNALLPHVRSARERLWFPQAKLEIFNRQESAAAVLDDLNEFLPNKKSKSRAALQLRSEIEGLKRSGDADEEGAPEGVVNTYAATGIPSLSGMWERLSWAERRAGMDVVLVWTSWASSATDARGPLVPIHETRPGKCNLKTFIELGEEVEELFTGAAKLAPLQYSRRRNVEVWVVLAAETFTELGVEDTINKVAAKDGVGVRFRMAGMHELVGCPGRELFRFVVEPASCIPEPLYWQICCRRNDRRTAMDEEKERAKTKKDSS